MNEPIGSIDHATLAAIRALIDACGPQSFDQVVLEVKTQCSCPCAHESASSYVCRHLDHLIKIRALVKEADDQGDIYGDPSDF